MDAIRINDLYDLNYSIAGKWMEQFTFPWEALSGISDMIIMLGERLPLDHFTEVEEHIWIAKSAKVAPTASIAAPCIIDENAEIRHCAFIRGSVLVGKNAVVGNSTELKNVILFDGVQVPHYNYVGDSILGHLSHMGAGSITSNVKSDKKPVVVHGEENYETGRKKFGAMLGDHVEIGCGSVLNPGTIVGKESNVYPLSSVRGVIPPKSIYKKAGEIAGKRE